MKCPRCLSSDIFVVYHEVKFVRAWWTYCNSCGTETKWAGKPEKSEIVWQADYLFRPYKKIINRLR